MVRDEADIIDLQLAFHLAAGVDFFIVTDHESRDGTTDVLESYARRDLLHLIPVSSPVKRQSEWVTRMARLAASEFGADWVINSDADEFWWPWGRPQGCSQGLTMSTEWYERLSGRSYPDGATNLSRSG
jgi:hypothetical protein